MPHVSQRDDRPASGTTTWQVDWLPDNAGERQQAALRLKAAYAMLLANRWIPDRPWGRNDTGREQGTGLVAGIRPRF